MFLLKGINIIDQAQICLPQYRLQSLNTLKIRLYETVNGYQIQRLCIFPSYQNLEKFIQGFL